MVAKQDKALKVARVQRVQKVAGRLLVATAACRQVLRALRVAKESTTTLWNKMMPATANRVAQENTTIKQDKMTSVPVPVAVLESTALLQWQMQPTIV